MTDDTRPIAGTGSANEDVEIKEEDDKIHEEDK